MSYSTIFTEFGKRSFSYLAPKIWNNLPDPLAGLGGGAPWWGPLGKGRREGGKEGEEENLAFEICRPTLSAG